LESLLFTLVHDLDERFAVSALDYLVTPVFHVLLDQWVVKLLADHALSVLNGVEWVLSDLVLGRVSDETLFVSECNLRWGCLVTLVVGYDFYVVVAEYSHTRLGCS